MVRQERRGNAPAKCAEEERASLSVIRINRPTPAPPPGPPTSPSCHREIRKIHGRISSTHVGVFRVFRGSKSVNQYQDRSFGVHALACPLPRGQAKAWTPTWQHGHADLEIPRVIPAPDTRRGDAKKLFCLPCVLAPSRSI